VQGAWWLLGSDGGTWGSSEEWWRVAGVWGIVVLQVQGAWWLLGSDGGTWGSSEEFWRVAGVGGIVVLQVNNDINVIHQSPCLMISKKEKHQRFSLWLTTYLTHVDIILLTECATFVKSISNPSDDDLKRIRYKRMHEAARKDDERTFGVLKKKWVVLANLGRPYCKEKIRNMMYT
nr:hypothetical protein [Tanacetum cinerariifolium]